MGRRSGPAWVGLFEVVGGWRVIPVGVCGLGVDAYHRIEPLGQHGQWFAPRDRGTGQGSQTGLQEVTERTNL